MEHLPEAPGHAGLGLSQDRHRGSISREQMIKEYVRQARERISAGQNPPSYMSSRPPSNVLDQPAASDRLAHDEMQSSGQPQWPLSQAESTDSQLSTSGPNGPNTQISFFRTGQDDRVPLVPPQPPSSFIQSRNSAPLPRQQVLGAPYNASNPADPQRHAQPAAAYSTFPQPFGQSRVHPVNNRPLQPSLQPQRIPDPRFRPPPTQQRHPGQARGLNQRPPPSFRRPHDRKISQIPQSRPHQGPHYRPGPQQQQQQQSKFDVPSRPSPLPPRIVEESETGRSAPSTVGSDDGVSSFSRNTFLNEETSTDDDSPSLKIGSSRSAPSKDHPGPGQSQLRHGTNGHSRQASQQEIAASARAASAVSVSLAPAEAASPPHLQTSRPGLSSGPVPLGSVNPHELFDFGRSPIDVHVTPADDDEYGQRPTSSTKLLVAPASAFSNTGRRSPSPSLGAVPEHSALLEPPRAANSTERLSPTTTPSSPIWFSEKLAGDRTSVLSRSSQNNRSASPLTVNERPDNARLSRFARFGSPNRESTTSLQGVIRRALRLATNLENGRTASRMGLDWMTAEADFNDEKKDKHASEASIGAMIDKFPTTPRLQSPAHSPYQRRVDEWPASALQASTAADQPALGTAAGGRCKRRKCCGMPVCIFVLIVLVVICLAAAAIVIPVALVVIPRQHRAANNTAHSTTNSIEYCQVNLPCANGGTSVLSASQTCQCLCANGFNGPTCTQQDDTACVVESFESAPNATIGFEIPNLIDVARANFSVPLNGPALLSIFASAQLSCTSENQLVELGSQVTRRHYTRAAAVAPSLPARSGEFAKVAILYVLQDSKNLNDAVAAQTTLQAFFANVSASAAVPANLGNGYSIDFANVKITTPSGTVGG